MAAYLTFAEFRVLSLMPGAFIDAVETREPGFVDGQLLVYSDWIDARLRKRYSVPFGAPVPNIVRSWLARIVTPRVWHQRGHDPTDLSYPLVAADDAEAREEIKEAANSDEGLFDLPLRSDSSLSGINSAGFPRLYSETSPYVFTDEQVATGRTEDGGRGGTIR